MIRKKTNEEFGLLRKFSLITLVAVYILILVGGIVRSSGSGMGCPDWPKCFGNWVPPTEVSQLPENYKEIYAEKRSGKNERFAKYLSALGFEKTAYRIRNDESILKEADFNKYKTWIEYVNRLVGVLIGFFILITFMLSIQFLKTRKTIFFVALAALLLVILQGWIGSVVVSTNLVPWMVTVHMFLALVIVALLIYLVYKTQSGEDQMIGLKKQKTFLLVLTLCILTSMVQIAFGTQVREGIDHIAAAFNDSQRELWIANLGYDFIVHRSFSWVVLFVHLWLLYLLYKESVYSQLTYALFTLVVLTIISGTAMAYFAIPAFLQPVHLLLGTLIFGIQFLLFLQVFETRRMTGAKA